MHCRTCDGTFYVLADKPAEVQRCPYCGWEDAIEVKKAGAAWEIECPVHGKTVVVSPSPDVDKGLPMYCPFDPEPRKALRK